jgi:hypothetical protein
MNQSTENMHIVRRFGWLGILASLLVGVGEFLIHFSPSGFEGVPFQWLRNVPDDRISVGHFLVVFGVPFYVFGYWHLHLALRPGSKRLAEVVLSLGIFAFIIGGMWVSSRAMLAQIVKTGDAGLLAYYDSHYEILVQFLRIIVLVLSIAFAWAVWRGGTLYPKWMAFFAPVLPLALVFLSYLAIPAFGRFLVPTAMNATHLLLFSASLWSLYNQNRFK